jgi:4,5-DOPA dioxygenase extradiol
MTLPAAFITDMGPMPAVEEDDYTEALGRLGASLPRPRAVIVMSGHWDAAGTVAVSGARRPGIVHDFYGFPPEFYRLDYPVPGDPPLARRAVALLQEAGISARVDDDHKLDHGAWVPLSRVFPDADVPTVQISVPAGENPRFIMSLGRALAALRREDVLLLASGTLVHNLRRMRFGATEIDAWAEEFDHWLSERLDAGSLDDLVQYRVRAPHATLAAPTTEHFDPLFFVLGAVPNVRPRHLYHAIRHGNGLLRVFTLG